MNSFPKTEKLCGEKLVSALFEEGKAFIEYPIRVVYRSTENTNNSHARILVVVPKKKIKKANQRNLLKRRIREAYRIQKSDFISALSEKNLYLHIAFSYVADKEIEYSTIQSKMPVIFNKIMNKFNKVEL